MYPRNAASPEPIAIGPVVQISDGAVQTAGVTVRVKPIGVAEADGGGTTAYSADGVVLYTPTQAETNYTSFVLIAKKTGCIPASVTVVTSASNTTGYAGTDRSKILNPTSTVNLSGTTISTSQTVASVTNRVTANTDQWNGVSVTGMPMPTYTQPTGFLTATFPATVASTTNITSASGIVLAAQTHTGAVIPTVTSVTNAVVLPSSATINITGNLTGNVTGSVGSVTGNVGGNVVGSIGSISGVTFPSNFAALGINASGHISRVVLVDTTTTNTDMRGTDGAALATNWTATRAGYLDGVLIAANYNQRTVSVTGSNHVAADIHDLQPAVINNTHFDVGAIDASAIASNAITSAKIAAGAITSATFAADSITATALATSAGEEIADKVWDEAIAAHLGSGSTGEALNNAGGSGNPWITDLATGYTGTQAGNILNQVKAKTDLITTGTIQSSIPVTAQGQIVGPLYIGDDYLNANGRSFQWTVALPSGFVAGTATCKFGMDHAEGAETGASFLVSGTVVDVGSGNVTLRFDVPRVTTGDLVPGYYRWSVEIASAGGNEVTRVASAGNKLVEWREKQT